MKFKLVAALPDVSLGSIAEKDFFGNYNFVTAKMSVRTYSAKEVENQPHFFERVIEFEVNDVVLFDTHSQSGEGIFVKLTKINRNFVDVLFQNGATDEGSIENCIRKASELETVNYYVNSGWEKGALVKENGTNNIYPLNYVHIRNKTVICNLVCTVSGSLKLNIENCELMDYYAQKPYDELGSISGYTFEDGRLDLVVRSTKTTVDKPFFFATRNQCLSVMAFAKLSHLHEDALVTYSLKNKGLWLPDFEKYDPPMFFIRKKNNACVVIKQLPFEVDFFPFPTKELANKFLDANKNLFEEYYAI